MANFAGYITNNGQVFGATFSNDGKVGPQGPKGDPGPQGPKGEPGRDGYDDTQIKEEISKKQDKLIAGDNITINGNTISSTGGGSGNILTFTNKMIEVSSWVEDTTYEDFAYKADIACEDVTTEFFSDVVFNVPEAISRNYAPISVTGAGIVTIYAVEVPESAITIPSIICSKGA